MYVVFTRMPGESYRRRFKSLLLCLCYVFRALITSLVCWLRTSALGLVLFRIVNQTCVCDWILFSPSFESTQCILFRIPASCQLHSCVKCKYWGMKCKYWGVTAILTSLFFSSLFSFLNFLSCLLDCCCWWLCCVLNCDSAFDLWFTDLCFELV